MADVYTKDERDNLHRAVFDIVLFLRLAHLRIENRPDALPFKPVEGHAVLNWLAGLATRYANGEDITT